MKTMLQMHGIATIRQWEVALSARSQLEAITSYPFFNGQLLYNKTENKSQYRRCNPCHLLFK